MKILITGTNGFIGKHLAKALLQKGYEVTGLGKQKEPSVIGLHRYYSGNILDKALVARAMSGVDIVIHLAALTTHAEIVDKKFETLEINFLGTKNVLDAFSHSHTAKKFIYTSTGKVYGKITQLPLTENHPTEPINILGKAKLITEQLIDFYANAHQEFIIFRIFNLYGPGQKSNFLIPTILNQLLKSDTITLGDIEAKRDYTYIDDVIEAFHLAIEKKQKSGVFRYNICTGVPISAEEIVTKISSLLNKNIHIKKNMKLMRHDEMNEEYGSYQLVKQELGWKPTLSLSEGLKKLCKQLS